MHTWVTAGWRTCGAAVHMELFILFTMDVIVMDTTDKLERSVIRLLESNKELRTHRDRSLKNEKKALDQLFEAKAVAGRLRKEVRDIEKSGGKPRMTEKKKNEIKEKIRDILEKLNKIDNIDQTTNV